MKEFLVLFPLFIIGFGAALGFALLSPEKAVTNPLCNPLYCIYEPFCST